MEKLKSMVSLDIVDVIKNKDEKNVPLSDILEAVAIINSKLDLNHVLKKVIYYAIKLTSSVAASIILTNDSDNDLVIAHSTDMKSNIRFPRTKGIAGQCISTGQIKIVNDANENPYHFIGVDESTGFTTKSILCVPLNIKGSTIGCVELVNKRDNTQFNNDDIAIAALISNLASVSIRNAESHEKLQKEITVLKSQQPFDEMIIGKNKRVREIFKTIKKLKDTNTTVMILGESGTGKGILARAIHEKSSRKGRPFVTLNCSTFSQTLLESELFGHEKGAFTGANNLKKGRFELADGGTIFLDEIGEIDKSTQTKLLRVLQEKAFERVGGTDTLITDIRIIAATNADLEEAIRQNLFRQDLYYRLKVVVFKLPPLRDRKEDISAFANFFLEKYCNELNKHISGFDDNSMNVLQSYDYRGNIRELENIVERAVVLAEDDVIHTNDLPDEMHNMEQGNKTPIDNQDNLTTIPELEKDAILKSLIENSWNQSKTARSLGISRDQLRYRIQKYEINK